MQETQTQILVLPLLLMLVQLHNCSDSLGRLHYFQMTTEYRDYCHSSWDCTSLPSFSVMMYFLIRLNYLLECWRDTQSMVWFEVALIFGGPQGFRCPNIQGFELSTTFPKFYYSISSKGYFKNLPYSYLIKIKIYIIFYYKFCTLPKIYRSLGI